MEVWRAPARRCIADDLGQYDADETPMNLEKVKTFLQNLKGKFDSQLSTLGIGHRWPPLTPDTRLQFKFFEPTGWIPADLPELEYIKSLFGGDVNHAKTAIGQRYASVIREVCEQDEVPFPAWAHLAWAMAKPYVYSNPERDEVLAYAQDLYRHVVRLPGGEVAEPPEMDGNGLFEVIAVYCMRRYPDLLYPIDPGIRVTLGNMAKAMSRRLRGDGIRQTTMCNVFHSLRVDGVIGDGDNIGDSLFDIIDTPPLVGSI